MNDLKQNASAVESHATNLLLLTWTAGMLDGLSYVRAHLFTANMTGNLVLLGIHLVQRDFADAARLSLVLLAFAIGCVLAGLLILEREDHGRSMLAIGLSAELFFLIIFVGFFQLDRARGGTVIQGALISTAAVALAIQSVVVRRLRVSGVVTTFITGTITTSILGIIRLVRKEPPSDGKAEGEHVALLTGMLVVYFIAVVFATLLIKRVPLMVAATPAVILGIVLWRSSRHSHAP